MTSTTTTTNNNSITTNSTLDRSPPQLSPLTSIQSYHRCIAATRDIILNNTLQRKRSWGGAPRRGREGGREGAHIPIIKQLQDIVLHLNFLSKLRIIVAVPFVGNRPRPRFPRRSFYTLVWSVREATRPVTIVFGHLFDQRGHNAKRWNENLSNTGPMHRVLRQELLHSI